MEDKNFLRTLQSGEAIGYSRKFTLYALTIFCTGSRATYDQQEVFQQSCLRLGKSLTKPGHQLFSGNIIYTINTTSEFSVEKGIQIKSLMS